MDNLILIFIGVGGVALEAYFARRERRLIAERLPLYKVAEEQSRKKEENKKMILFALSSSRENRITNNEVEKMLGVSDATTERYLDELESEGKIVQRGKTGQSVFYTLKQ